MSGKLEVIDVDKTTFEEEEADPNEFGVKVGEWYWVYPSNDDRDEGEEEDEEDFEEEEGEDEDADKPWFGCAIFLGSNYVELRSPKLESGGYYQHRIHMDVFHQRCKKERDPESVIQRHIDRYQNRVKALMGDVQEITRRLAVSPETQLAQAGSDTQALATLEHAQDMGEYKNSLVKAKKEILPDLFDKMRKGNEAMAAWMSARVIPMEAQARAMKDVIGVIENRIFSVELYAGLTEEVEQISDGEPAAAAAKVHLMQRLCFMDEECLAQYETGGMEFRHITEFDEWFARPVNRDRLLPFPRCIVSFRVRRNQKERERPFDIGGFVRLMGLVEADKATFLYMRNGDNVYRMSTSLDFGDKLFPDMEKTDLEGPMWARMFSSSVKELIPDREYQWMVEEDEKTRAAWEEKKKTLPKDEWWRNSPRYHLQHETYEPFNPDSVYYDDMAKKVGEEIAHYNRIALILQGLFDRSPVFLPHPKVKMWTPAGFDAAIKLLYDKDRAIAPADMPDFEEYRAKLNESLKKGSMTVGQDDAWMEHETEKENERRSRSRYDHHYEASNFRPHGNPGPGTVSEVTRFGRAGKVSYAWMRERQRYPHDQVRTTFTTGIPNVMNVDAYTPGDFKRFFDDPRTRAEYLEWAPSMLAAEEYHAGNLVEMESGGLEMPYQFRPRDEPLPDDGDDDEEDTEEADSGTETPYQRTQVDPLKLAEDRFKNEGSEDVGDEWIKFDDVEVWRIRGMKIARQLKLIEKARTLPKPPRGPRPGKRIKIGKGFDVCCRQASDAKPTDKMYRRFFLRKRSKKTGKRHTLCMTLSWESMVEHMGWKDNDEQDS